MKRIKMLFLPFTLIVLSINLIAQEPPKFIYCEIVGTEKLLSKKVTISINFGQEQSMWKDERLKDPKTGKRKVFNSMIDALNFMGSQGWELTQAYIITYQGQSVYHYLLKKPSSK